MNTQAKCLKSSRRVRGWWLAVAMSAVPVVSLAQTDEIQVYDAAIAEKGKFNLMLHNNFTSAGLKDPAFPGAKESEEGEIYRSAFAATGGLPRLPNSAREARLVASYADDAEVSLDAE